MHNFLEEYVDSEDVVNILVVVAVLATFYEVQVRKYAEPALYNKSWKHGEVYLYCLGTPDGHEFTPCVKTLQVETALRLLGVRYEKMDIEVGRWLSRRDSFPVVEMEGQRLSQYDQIVNAVCTMYPSNNWSDYFVECLNDVTSRREVNALAILIHDSMAENIMRRQWGELENAASMSTPPATLLGTIPIFNKTSLCIQKAATHTYDQSSCIDAIHKELTIIENFLTTSPSICKGLCADGLFPGPHDCSIYAAVKIALDTPLRLSLLPAYKSDYPHCRAYINRIENILEDL